MVVALGLLLMHGLDARATGEGHGFIGSSAASRSDVHGAVSHADVTAGGAGETAATTGHAMLGSCIAVLTGAGLLLLALVAIGRVRRRSGGRFASRPAHGVAIAALRHRGSPPLPRVALCVSLC